MLFPCPRHMVSSRKLCVAARNRLEKQVIRPRHMVYVEKPCVANRGSASAEFSSFGGQWSFRPGYRPAMSEMPDQVGHDGERAPGQGPGQTRADQGRPGQGRDRAEQGRTGQARDRSRSQDRGQNRNGTARHTTSALHKQKIPCDQTTARDLEGAQWDSNPRHSEPQSDALTN